MKNSNITIVYVMVFVFVGFFIWGYYSKGGSTASVQGVRSAEAASLLTAKESVYDFGTISMKNGNVEKDFEVTNPTNDDILVTQLVTSCMCTAAYIVEAGGGLKGPYGMPGHSGAVPPANETIKAGETRIIRAVYDPNAHGPAGVGPIDRFVILTDESGASLQLEIKALVTP